MFDIDISVCERCAGTVKVIACIDDPLIIDAILTHLAKKVEKERAATPARAPPAITRIEQQLAQLTRKA